MTRNGKIARLPKAIREELNQRLQEGTDTGRVLADWLNGLPEVRAAMNAHFAGSDIREQNLSEWKKGGYVEWLRHQEAMALAGRLYEQAEEMEARGQEKPRLPMSEVLSLWLSARYVVATQEVEAAAGSEEGWKMLRQMCGDVMRLRRSDQGRERLRLEGEQLELRREEVQIERERFALEKETKQAAAPSRQKRPANGSRGSSGGGPAEASGADTQGEERPWQDWSDEERIAWARRPENMDRIKPPLTEEEHRARLRAIFGLPTPNMPHS